MHSIRWILILFFLVISQTVSAIFNYQQDLTISTFRSEKETKKLVDNFCLAAKGDPNLAVVNIRYRQKKFGKNLIAYEAILECCVSEIDKDLYRVYIKSLQE